MLYRPGFGSRNTYSPSGPVKVCTVTFVARSVSTTEALGTTWPLGSRTCPTSCAIANTNKTIYGLIHFHTNPVNPKRESIRFSAHRCGLLHILVKFRAGRRGGPDSSKEAAKRCTE